jgi:beta-N-acetylhexosaminidase
VLPVIKHMPGHGRARADSHTDLPMVDATLEALQRADFRPFNMLCDMPWAMTAHIVFTAIDPDRPATVSARVMREIVRGMIGYRGFVVSDDICMNALSGTPAERARAALEAGCDAVLHCSGAFDEMQAVATATPRLTDEAQARIEHAELMRDGRRRNAPAPPRDMAAELNRLLSAAGLNAE